MKTYLLVLMIFFPDGHFERHPQNISATNIDECIDAGNKLGKTYPGDYQLICKRTK